MSALLGWGWLSNYTIATLLLACEVGAGVDEHQRFNEMRLVAHVVLNRIESQQFQESTVQQVALAPRQFSCVGDSRWAGLLAGSRTQRYPQHWPPVLETARLAWKAAEMERNEWGEDPTRGATFYFSPVSMRPEWYGPDGEMPKGWDPSLVETTPAYIDPTRFRFFAFPGELRPEADAQHADDMEVSIDDYSAYLAVDSAVCRTGGKRDSDDDLPSPGAPCTNSSAQPAGRSRPYPESGGR